MLSRIVKSVVRADQRNRDLQKLRGLDACHLADMGIARDAVEAAFRQGRGYSKR